MREAYHGLPIPNNNYFDTESVRRVILDMKRGKAADIDGLIVEHLQYSHPVLAVLLSKFLKLIVSSHYIPVSFKCGYIWRSFIIRSSTPSLEDLPHDFSNTYISTYIEPISTKF